MISAAPQTSPPRPGNDVKKVHVHVFYVVRWNENQVRYAAQARRLQLFPRNNNHSSLV
jgi:hypothetical protein